MVSCWTSVCLSVRPSVIRPSVHVFVSGRSRVLDVSRFSPNLVIIFYFSLGTAIVEIWFGIANGHISSIFDRHIPTTIVSSLPDDNLSKYRWVFITLGMYIDIVEIGDLA